MISYKKIAELLEKVIDKKRIFTDPLYTLAKGTDAGFYRLIPKVVVRVQSEDEVEKVISICNRYGVSVTFKAAGTSLSGQTVTNSILVEIGEQFSSYNIFNNGELASFDCGVTGSFANNKLSKYGRKLGPSPASINSAKIGGIVSNNSSGASYGIRYNSYNTIKSMRILFADGSILDTGCEESVANYRNQKHYLLRLLKALSQSVKNSPKLRDKIKQKYELKNTCGYGLNSLIDFDDPIDIISHLMIGSEGTLGFISNVTFKTVEDPGIKATSLIFFTDVKQACDAIPYLRKCRVSAAELMDRNALRSVESRSGMSEVIKDLDDEVVALLIDTAAYTTDELTVQISDIEDSLKGFKTVYPVKFTTNEKEYNRLWQIRKGLFTSAAAPRPVGTTCIIEDLAFRAEVLGDALIDLKQLINDFGYDGSVIWGHLLDGNIHFVVMPDFNSEEGIAHYGRFMDQLAILTIDKYNGSLKAEHGTGRNMAPFIEKEWGGELYDIMKLIKSLFDPQNIMNCGVLINDDFNIHLKNFKPVPPVHELIDKCIECGFCEINCPSKNLTLTPRQRITVYREIERLKRVNDNSLVRYLQKEFGYNGDKTCATDGLCALACPVEIDTGELIKEMRINSTSSLSRTVAGILEENKDKTLSALRLTLTILDKMHSFFGTKVMNRLMSGLRYSFLGLIPAWNSNMPVAASPYSYRNNTKSDLATQNSVVYFPSCLNRSMGNSRSYKEKIGLVDVSVKLLEKGGYNVVFPEKVEKLCCGMAFNSKGFKKQGEKASQKLEEALLKASDNGRIPVYCDMSPCLLYMKSTLSDKLDLFDPVSFILKKLKPRLNFSPVKRTVAIHSTCSNTKMDQKEDLFELIKMCANSVFVPDNIECCGWAGDRGFTHPELNRSALATLKEQVCVAGAQEGYSTSRTCEIGLSNQSGLEYKSVIYLVDEVTTPKN
ncbi:FAD-binding and (Fe-S)-binding domain-containing protein [Marinilabiliaceae bacterium ANBcel2]|nr:FAD-binding and (Fe-S)-binding domain-containing protein [Marinilabiliaceae bacterium ANBcel2]